jgi:uncharacterized delta-60 repeat protein/RHS repeat-associated protein
MSFEALEVRQLLSITQLIDDGDAAYAETGGNWLGYSETGAYQGDFRYHAAGAGQNIASWIFEALDPAKNYQVFVTWSAQSNRATNSPFTILNDTTALNTVRINQQFTPDEVTIDGQSWESLGVYQFSSGKLVVKLSDDANGYVIADAVRIVEVPTVTEAPTVIDDGDAAYAEAGSNWLGYSETGAYQNDFRYHAAGTGQNSASWTFEALDPAKNYQVFATWSAQSNRATNSPFTILDDATALNTVRINQQFAPDEVTVDGQPWESLGVYQFSSGKLVVSLSDDANGYVIADAVRIVEVPAVTQTPTVIDDGDAAYTEAGGNWLGYSETGAYQGDFRYHAAGAGQNSASWTFEALDPAKNYQVFATWSAQSNRATNSPFTVLNDTTVLNRVRLNQQFAPDEVTVDGQPWESLGVYQFSSGKLVVKLSDDANGYVIADAIRIVPVNTPPVALGISDVTVQEGSTDTLVDLTDAFKDIDDPIETLRYELVGNTNPALFSTARINVGSRQLLLEYLPEAYGFADLTVRAFDPSGLYTDTTFTVNVTAVNDPPTTVANTTLLIHKDAQPTILNLYSLFTDLDNTSESLTYQVLSNSNSNLVTPSIDQGQLTLTYQTGAVGAATIVVRATDPGGLYADHTFDLTVSQGNIAPQVQSLSSVPDPAIEGAALHLEALGVIDDVHVDSVSFWRDADGNGIFDPILDQLLGTDSDGSNGWKLTVSSAGFGTGPQRYFAQAMDDQNLSGNVATTTGSVGADAIIDDSMSCYTETGTDWTSGPSDVGYQDGSRRHAAGMGDNTACWTFEGLVENQYTVFVTWSSDAGLASNAPFKIYDGDELLGTFLVDQRQEPYGVYQYEKNWLELGTFTVHNGRVTVELSDAANGTVVADAVWLVDPVPQIGSLTVSNPGVTRQQTAPSQKLILQANNVQAYDQKQIQQVVFYRDLNGNAQLDTQTDLVLGTGTQVTGTTNWQFEIDTAKLPAGTQTYFAVAYDDYSPSRTSTPKYVTHTILGPGVVGKTTTEEGATYTLNLDAGDFTLDTQNGWTIDWGDGSQSENYDSDEQFVQHSFHHISSANNPVTITATAHTESNDYVSTISVNVQDVKPYLWVESEQKTVDEGSPYTLHLHAIDPGQETLQWKIQWGDGAIDYASGYDTPVTHTYADGDQTYTINVTATNVDDNYAYTYTLGGTVGTLDTSFGTAGKVAVNITDGGTQNGRAMTVQQSDGKILVVGEGAEGSSYLIRYSSGGGIDADFGAQGKVAIANITATAVALQTDGKILVAGYTNNGTNNNDFCVIRYNADGSLDLSFGVDGRVLTNFATGSQDYAQSIVIQSDGRIVVAGSSNSDFAVARYHANGNLDVTFGTAGKVTTDFGYYYEDSEGEQCYFNSGDYGYGVAIQDGKIVVVGSTYGYNYNHYSYGYYYYQYFALARYDSYGNLDTTFGDTGKKTDTFTHYPSTSIINNVACGVKIQSDNKIVVVGYTYINRYSNSNYDFALARYNSNGGTNCQTTTDFGSNDIGYAVAIQSDNKIVVAGSTSANGGDFALARYNITTLSLDTNFGTGGKTTTNFSGSSADSGYAVATATVEDVEKIIVAGSSAGNFALARYNTSNGQLDTNFGTNNPPNGKVTTDFPGSTDNGNAVAIQSDGKIVAAGATSTNGNDFALIRVDSFGNLDSGFDGDGIATTNFSGNSNDYGAGVAIQTIDGVKNIIVAGTSGNDFALARYSDAGLDTTFGNSTPSTNGLARLNINSTDVAKAVTIQQVGNEQKILVAGYTVNGSNQEDFALARFNADGGIDSNFGTGGQGYVTTNFHTGSRDYGCAVALQHVGSATYILVAGYTYYNGDYDFALARYTENGGPDTSFGNGDGYAGYVTTSFSGPQYGYAIAIQSDNKIVVAGMSNNNFALVRYSAEGVFESGFGPSGSNGLATADFGGNDYGYSVAIQPDDKIIVAGYTSANGNDFALARFNSDGTLDNSNDITPDSNFDNDGKLTTDFSGAADYGRSIVLQPDGRIIVAGQTGGNFAMARYNPGVIEQKVTVKNVAPYLSISGDRSVTEGSPYLLHLSSSDPGEDTIQQWDIDWGDGTDPDGDNNVGEIVAGNPSGVTHYYASTGNYTISATATDEDGTYSTGGGTAGSLDVTFGTGGESITPPISNVINWECHGMAVQSDGKIIMVGYDDYGKANMVRCRADGSLDASFGDNGQAADSPINDIYPLNIGLQPDGKIVAVGNYNNSWVIVRYLNDGTPDANFGDGGELTIDSIDINAMTIQPDGKILVAGELNNNGNYEFAVACYNSDGSLDTDFGTNGIATADFSSGGWEWIYAIGLQTDGKIMVAGNVNLQSVNEFALARFTSDGDLDTSFDNDGKTTTPIGATVQYLAIGSDGRIIVGGYDNNTYNLELACYTSDGSLDTTFATDGILVADSFWASGMAIQPDGKIVAVGSNGTNDFSTIRFLANGSLNADFGNQGVISEDFGDGCDCAYAVKILPDGRILVGGMADDNNLALVCYNPGEIEQTVGVNKIPPTMTLAPVFTLGEDIYLLDGTGTFINPYPDQETWSVTIDYGDGSDPEQLELDDSNTFNFDHTYSNVGSYPVTVSLDNGVDDPSTVSFTINDDSPDHFGDINLSVDCTLVFNPVSTGDGIEINGRISGNGGLTLDEATSYDSGILTLSGVNTYSGLTDVRAGTLNVTGSIANSNVSVGDGGTLSGSGTIYSDVFVQSGGTLAPNDGSSTTILRTGNLIFGSYSTYSVQINGKTAGSEYGQTQVTGSIILENYAELSTSGSGETEDDSVIVIILNDGDDPVQGTFSGYAEGAVVMVNNSVRYQITYHYDAEHGIFGTGNDVVLINATWDVGPSFAEYPAASVDSSGKTATLTALGTDYAGEANLIYTWEFDPNPETPGVPEPTLSVNGTNAAKETVATFTSLGTYAFKITITDPCGLSTYPAEVYDVHVVATVGSITVSPSSTTLAENGTQVFTATCLDQFGNSIITPSTVEWTAPEGGSIEVLVDTNGNYYARYTAPTTPGTYTVTATFDPNEQVSGDEITASSSVLVINEAPTVVTAAAASDNPVPITSTTTNLSVSAADDGGEENLTYTWSVVSLTLGAPNVTFSSVNGTNGAKSTVATFTPGDDYDYEFTGGDYKFTVTISDGDMSTTSSVNVTVSQELSSTMSLRIGDAETESLWENSFGSSDQREEHLSEVAGQTVVDIGTNFSLSPTSDAPPATFNPTGYIPTTPGTITDPDTDTINISSNWTEASVYYEATETGSKTTDVTATLNTNGTWDYQKTLTTHYSITTTADDDPWSTVSGPNDYSLYTCTFHAWGNATDSHYTCTITTTTSCSASDGSWSQVTTNTDTIKNNTVNSVSSGTRSGSGGTTSTTSNSGGFGTSGTSESTSTDIYHYQYSMDCASGVWSDGEDPTYSEYSGSFSSSYTDGCDYSDSGAGWTETGSENENGSASGAYDYIVFYSLVDGGWQATDGSGNESGGGEASCSYIGAGIDSYSSGGDSMSVQYSIMDYASASYQYDIFATISDGDWLVSDGSYISLNEVSISNCSYFGTGAYTDSAGGVTMSGTLQGGGSSNAMCGFGVTATYSTSGDWIMTGNGLVSWNQNDNSSYNGHGQYSFSGGGCTGSVSLNESGNDSSSSHGMIAYNLVPIGDDYEWQANGVAIASVGGSSNWAYSGSGTYTDGLMSGTFNGSGGDNTSYTAGVGSTYTDNVLSEQGSGSVTASGSEKGSYKGSGAYHNDYSDNGVGYSSSGTLKESGSYNDSYNGAATLSLDELGEWQATGSSGGGSGSAKDHFSYSGSGKYWSYNNNDNKQTSYSGTFTENGSDDYSASGSASNGSGSATATEVVESQKTNVGHGTCSEAHKWYSGAGKISYNSKYSESGKTKNTSTLTQTQTMSGGVWSQPEKQVDTTENISDSRYDFESHYKRRRDSLTQYGETDVEWTYIDKDINQDIYQDTICNNLTHETTKDDSKGSGEATYNYDDYDLIHCFHDVDTNTQTLIYSYDSWSKPSTSGNNTVTGQYNKEEYNYLQDPSLVSEDPREYDKSVDYPGFYGEAYYGFQGYGMSCMSGSSNASFAARGNLNSLSENSSSASAASPAQFGASPFTIAGHSFGRQSTASETGNVSASTLKLAGITDANGGVTRFSYDPAGNLTSLTDPVGNTTSWTYEGGLSQFSSDENGTVPLRRVTSETNQLGLTRYFAYDDSGNLARYTDRNARVNLYQYDSSGNVASETWYADSTDADNQQNALNTIVYQRDSAGRITFESDDYSSVVYVYNDAGQITSTTQTSEDSPTVTLAYQYDTAGRRTQMAAFVDSSCDFVDDYTYDSLGRVISVTEHGVTSGNAVATKEIDLVYNDAGQIASIDRYQDGQLTVEADYSYDAYGRLIGLVYHQDETVLAQYAWTYSGSGTALLSSGSSNSDWLPSGGLMPVTDTTGVTEALMSGGYAALDSLLVSCTSSDGTATYSYDSAGQLIGVTYSTSNPQSPIPNPSESYLYDANGNRTNSGYVIGAENRLLSDGTYTYQYDAEGNRIGRFIDENHDGVLDSGDADITQYSWDNRDRLTEVRDYADYAALAADTPTKVVDYIYDVENRLIEEKIDSNGDGTIDHETCYAYDGYQIVLQFDKDGTGNVTNADLSHRYLWQANAVDQLMADEQVTNVQTPGNVVWPLTDNLGTVRDLAVYDAQSGATSVANHRTFDLFGNLKSSINPTTGQVAAVDCIFGYTGRPVSKATGLQNNLNRWYDPIVAGWLTQDPIGFKSGTTNLYVYCGNCPVAFVDPSGLAWWNLGIGEVVYYFAGYYDQLDRSVELDTKLKAMDGKLRAGSFPTWNGISQTEAAGKAQSEIAQFVRERSVDLATTVILSGPYKYIRVESGAGYGAHFHLEAKSGKQIYIGFKTLEEAIDALPNSLRENQAIINAIKKVLGQ